MVFIIGDKEEGEAIRKILKATGMDMTKVIFSLSVCAHDEQRSQQMNKLLAVK